MLAQAFSPQATPLPSPQPAAAPAARSLLLLPLVAARPLRPLLQRPRRRRLALDSVLLLRLVLLLVLLLLPGLLLPLPLALLPPRPLPPPPPSLVARPVLPLVWGALILLLPRPQAAAAAAAVLLLLPQARRCRLLAVARVLGVGLEWLLEEEGEVPGEEGLEERRLGRLVLFRLLRLLVCLPLPPSLGRAQARRRRQQHRQCQ